MDCKSSACSSASSAADFLRIDGIRNARDNSDSDSAKVGGCSSRENTGSGFNQWQIAVDRNLGILLNDEISVPDSAGPSVPQVHSETGRPNTVRRTADDVWRDITFQKTMGEVRPKEELMTLEEFLLQAGAMEETPSASTSTNMLRKEEIVHEDESGMIGMRAGSGVGGFDGGRGKKNLILMDPSDKAKLQRQRRMVKNRESAARSRERKQAYQVELESIAMRLEEENRQLLEEMAAGMKKRLKQLMENVIPVTEKQEASARVRRVSLSAEW